jgi:hypothetical protein
MLDTQIALRCDFNRHSVGNGTKMSEMMSAQSDTVSETASFSLLNQDVSAFPSNASRNPTLLIALLRIQNNRILCTSLLKQRTQNGNEV